MPRDGSLTPRDLAGSSSSRRDHPLAALLRPPVDEQDGRMPDSRGEFP
jgi:hypothetical protein